MKNWVFASAFLLFSFTTQAADATTYDCTNIDSIYKDQDLISYTQAPIENIRASNLLPTKILISKDQRKLFLFSSTTLLRIYPVAFGRNPEGPKTMEGDFKTPEGKYTVDFKKFNSEYYRALHVSYPNEQDLERTKKLSQEKGKKIHPGGSIMIHGLPNDLTKKSLVETVHPMLNWTQGCIAVTNEEIEELYNLVPVETEIEICPKKFSTNTKGELKNLLQKWSFSR